MKYNEKNNAFFLDRDGVIIKDIGYLTMTNQISFLKNTFKALRLIQKKKFLLLIITNQSVVGRKLISKKKLEQIHLHIKYKLKKRGILISDIFYCPHHPKYAKGHYKIKCQCRKPGNLMIEKAIKKWNINRKKSFMIGDKFSDLYSAKKSKIKFLFRSRKSFYNQIQKII